MSDEDLLRVAMYESESEAMFVQSALVENGIEAKLTGNEASALGFALDGPDDIEVIVKRADFDKAKAIIEDLATAVPDEIPAWKCGCGEDVDEGFGMCWSCGAEYGGSNPAPDSDADSA